MDRNRKGVANFLNIVKRANGGARAYAERVGLKIDWDDPASNDFEACLAHPDTEGVRLRKFSLAVPIAPYRTIS